jgi:predicted flap endonuclease-1-like 5' DNA nuclease
MIVRDVVPLDEEGFRRYLKKTGKSERKIEFDIRNVKEFEEYLLKHKGKKLEEAASEDLKDFVNWAEETGTKIWLWVFNRYYSYKQDDAMFCATNELIGIQSVKKAKLKDFLGVNLQHVQALKAEGIVTVEQMLDAGKTREGREELEKKTGVPPDSILELVKLSNLARIIGLKKKRARLFYDAGLDTLDKIAEWDSEEMRQMLIEFVDRTGFDGSASTPSEAAFSVRLAKYLPRIVEY